MSLAHVADLDVLYAFFREHGGEYVDRVFRIPVNGGIGYQDALDLGSISAPLVIFIYDIIEMIAPDKTVQRAYTGDFKPRSLFEHRLDLRSVFAHDIGVISARVVYLISVVIHFVGIKRRAERAEGAEGVCGIKRLIEKIVCDHDLGPMHHGRHDKGELMPARFQHVTFLDDDRSALDVHGEIVLDHLTDLGVANYLRLRISLGDLFERGGMIGFHMVDDDEVERFSVKGVGDVFLELFHDSLIGRVYQDVLFVPDHIGVIRNAVGYRIKVLEKREPSVARSDEANIFGYLSYAMH